MSLESTVQLEYELLGAAACVFGVVRTHCRAFRRPTLDYNMDYCERVLLPGTRHDLWSKSKFESQFWPLHIKEKQGKGKHFCNEWQHLWAGIKLGSDGIPWWDPWTSGMRRACSRAREQLIVGPSRNHRNISLGGNRKRAGTRGAQGEGWLIQVGPPKDTFELGNEGGRKEAGCPGVRHKGKREECGCMDHWGMVGLLVQSWHRLPCRCLQGHTLPEKHWDLCAFWEKFDLLCRPFTAIGAWAVTMTGSKLCFRKDHPGGGEMGWHCSNGWDSSWGPAVGQFSGGPCRGWDGRCFTGDRLWDSGAAGFLLPGGELRCTYQEWGSPDSRERFGLEM